jgi:uncharacterized membrane-anchored protein YitT (DUF2179 family)
VKNNLLKAFKTTKTGRRIKNYLFILVGCLCYAAGVSLFLEPNSLTPGGLSGIAIIINHFFPDLTVGVTVFAMNVPLLIASFFFIGKEFLFSTLGATAISSVFIDLLAPFAPDLDDKMLCAIFGGFFMAFGLAFVFKGNATTGGTDIIVKLLRKKFRHIKTGTIMWGTDGAVIIATAAVFRDYRVALYATVTIFVQTIVMNYVLYGPDEAALVYIINCDHEKMVKLFMDKMEIGATLLDGTGAYTGNKKKVTLCAVKKQQLPMLKQIVEEHAPDAFLIVTSASAVFGEGFKEIDTEEL